VKSAAPAPAAVKSAASTTTVGTTATTAAVSASATLRESCLRPAHQCHQRNKCK
jgi:hypothetical protein